MRVSTCQATLPWHPPSRSYEPSQVRGYRAWRSRGHLRALHPRETPPTTWLQQPPSTKYGLRSLSSILRVTGGPQFACRGHSCKPDEPFRGRGECQVQAPQWWQFAGINRTTLRLPPRGICSGGRGGRVGVVPVPNSGRRRSQSPTITWRSKQLHAFCTTVL